eukprot:SAG31_NODE_37794_length_301_cov_1.019802_1_plen_76_part_10
MHALSGKVAATVAATRPKRACIINAQISDGDNWILYGRLAQTRRVRILKSEALKFRSNVRIGRSHRTVGARCELPE